MPYRKMSRRKERLALYRLSLDIIRLVNDAVFGSDAAPEPESVYIVLCVGLGHAENRPMTATKIAHYSRIPRTTVLRKLEDLITVGVVERSSQHYYLSSTYLQFDAVVDRAKRFVVSTSAELNESVHFGHSDTLDYPP